jgi:hypothetical protein
MLSLFASECRLIGSGECWIAKKQSREQNKQIQKTKKRTGGVLSFFPPLPLARELKVGLAISKRSRRLRTSPVSWLGGISSPDSSRPARSLPAAPPIFERLAAVACVLAFSALQSRGGDGFVTLTPASPESMHRLPVHEVHGDCGGALPPAVGYVAPRRKSAASEYRKICLPAIQTKR